MCNRKCQKNYERDEILEILKDFKCLDKIREKIKEKYKKQSHLKEITNEISDNKEFIYYGGFPTEIVTNESRNDVLNSGCELQLDKKNRHYNYWLMVKKNDEELPKKTLHCLCFQCITNPCIIKNIHTNKLYVVGSECINKFVPEENRGRRCERCNIKHRNSKNNFCKDCRTIVKEEEKLKIIKPKKRKKNQEGVVVWR